MELHIIPYENSREAEWDRFVMQESANGTFLQTRRFLNYHPEGRFQDASFFVENQKNAIIAVIPAAVRQQDEKQMLISHLGSTYGGPVIRETYNTAERCLEVVQTVDQYASEHFDRAEFKLTPALLQKKESAALEYAFYHQDFYCYEELNTWVPLNQMNKDTLLASFRQNKKYDVKKALKWDLKFEQLDLKNIDNFYFLLCQSLSKYNARPVHTVDEMQELLENRLKKEASLFGVWDGNRLVAGSMTFSFVQCNVLHTQYIAYDSTIKDYSPAAFLYYKILEQGILDGYSCVSFGISTENHGKYLNQGLISSKEGYNARHDINRTYYKNFRRGAIIY